MFHSQNGNMSHAKVGHEKTYPANTQIPIASLNQFAATVLGQLPTVAAGTARSNDLFESLLIKDYADKYDVKLELKLNYFAAASFGITARNSATNWARTRSPVSITSA